MPEGLRTEVIPDRESFRRLAPAWQQLLDFIGDRHPQLEHGWMDAWWRHFGGDERVRLVLLWRGDRLAAALPLRHTRGRVVGLPVRELRLLENNETTRGPLLMARDDVDAARALLAAALAEPGWDRLYWRNLADPEGAPALLAAAARQAGLLATVDTDLMAPVRSLAATWEEFLRSLSRAQRHEVQRAERKAKQSGGGYRLIIHQRAGPGLEGALETLYRLARASWQHTSTGTSIASRPDLWGFYRDISQRLARDGRLLLAILEIGGEAAGFDLGLRAGETIHILKTGFDPRFRGFSPGRLQVVGVIRHGIETGARTLDFMGSVDEFKRRWSCHIVPQVVLIATRRRLLPMGAHLLRHVAAPALANTAALRPVVSWLRRNRRR